MKTPRYKTILEERAKGIALENESEQLKLHNLEVPVPAKNSHTEQLLNQYQSHRSNSCSSTTQLQDHMQDKAITESQPKLEVVSEAEEPQVCTT